MVAITAIATPRTAIPKMKSSIRTRVMEQLEQYTRKKRIFVVAGVEDVESRNVGIKEKGHIRFET